MLKISEIENEKLYKISEVAEMARVSPRTIRRYCLEKVFKEAIKIGKLWLIPGSSLNELIKFGGQNDL